MSDDTATIRIEIGRGYASTGGTHVYADGKELPARSVSIEADVNDATKATIEVYPDEIVASEPESDE